MNNDNKTKGGNNGGGKSRKRRPIGYPERHRKALDWINSNLQILYIFPSTEDREYSDVSDWINEQNIKLEESYEGGRPPDYRPQYCIDMLYGGKMGRTLIQIARDIGTVSMALNRWADKYEDFRYAVDISKEWKLAWLEDMALGQISGTIRGNSGMLRFALVNASPGDYADIKVIETRLANKPPKEQPAIDFNAIPIEDRIVLMEGFRKAAKGHQRRLSSEDVEDAEIVTEKN